MGKVKGFVKDLVVTTVLACIGIALLQMVPGVKDMVKKYVLGGTV